MRPAVLFIGVSLLSSTPTPAADPPPVPKVTAVKLVETFLGNEAFADEHYSGKEIEVTGKVVRISRSKTPEKEYVLEFDLEGKGRAAKIDLELLARFDEKERAELAKLKIGQTIRIRGTCSRSILWAADVRSRDRDYSEVHLIKCILLLNKVQSD